LRGKHFRIFLSWWQYPKDFTMLIYLDWNILNKIEKKSELPIEEFKVYEFLENFVKLEGIFTPFSNAHLQDLIRGFKKNPTYIDGHLQTIEKVTQNLCICQYWGKQNTVFHYRDVREFFQSAIDEKEFEADSFEDLLKTDDPEINSIVDLQHDLFKSLPVPKDFKKIYQVDPIFSTIYPTTKNEMNMFALSSDLYNFSLLINKDYSIYRALRRFIIMTMNNYKQNDQILKLVKSTTAELPKYLNFDEVIDEVKINSRSSKNPHYDKLIDTFFKFDIKGYKSDNAFPNLIDDALHTFYASHCDYFITNDDRCKHKAIKTFEKLQIETITMTANEFALNVLPPT
jgi:hypothetical protein